MLILSVGIFPKPNAEKFANFVFMIKFKILEHTADIAVEVVAPDLEKLFEYSADAWLTAVADTDNVYPDTTRTFSMSSSTLEVLLVDFLSELNYLLNTKKWLYLSTQELSIVKNGKYKLHAKISGTKLNGKKVKLKAEIKAITFHQMNIEQTGNGYKTKIIFDI